MKSSKLKLGNSKYKEKRPIERNKDKDKNEWNSSYFLKFRIMKKKNLMLSENTKNALNRIYPRLELRF